MIRHLNHSFDIQFSRCLTSTAQIIANKIPYVNKFYAGKFLAILMVKVNYRSVVGVEFNQSPLKFFAEFAVSH